MIHYPTDRLPLDFTKAERKELVKILREVAGRARQMLAVTENDRLKGMFRLIEARGYRLAANLEEEIDKWMVADDVRFIRNHCPVGSRSFKAVKRVWEKEAVK